MSDSNGGLVLRPHPPEPTAEQCQANAPVEWADMRGFACWYPQMGGYVGKCVMELQPADTGAEGGQHACFDAWVWHDGEFPFGDDGRPPVRLHHCDADQFMDFGDLVATRIEALFRRPEKAP